MKASCRTLRAKSAACRQQQGSDRGKDERVGVAGEALNGVPRDHRDRGSERGHLRQRKIGKHHVPPQHLEAKPSVNAGEDDGCRERQGRECEDILQHDTLSSTRPTAPAPEVPTS